MKLSPTQRAVLERMAEGVSLEKYEEGWGMLIQHRGRVRPDTIMVLEREGLIDSVNLGNTALDLGDFRVFRLTPAGRRALEGE